MDLLTVWTAEAWGGGGDAVGEQGWRREERDGEGGREGEMNKTHSSRTVAVHESVLASLNLLEHSTPWERSAYLCSLVFSCPCCVPSDHFEMPSCSNSRHCSLPTHSTVHTVRPKS